MINLLQADETTAIKIPQEEKKFTGSYVIPRLRPATHYVARVSSQNTYGYSNPSQVFTFSTKGARPAQEPLNGGAPARASAAFATLALAMAVARLF